ncbi:MAG: CoA-binding protein [Armatimonadota bacterium]|nr:CoA-binding protein [Armatimonadota bacterium]MDR7404334.1 CoA-binding protein [Armatimonadota bacterium]MDR7508213.1 CoA-binding protein [Armatimonadota bacterium]MDR7560737.1 CoA-binding protein [Armatimonadota bacterium]MDR7582303.1 CoA-binding protein [Armatimonadota bacterium]
MRDLRPLLSPRSVAVVGASTNPAKAGGILFKNLVDGGFSGPLYPVNPRADTVLGYTAYARVGDLPAAPDLAFVVLPRAAVCPVVEECAAAGVRAVCIITSGFGEADAEGRREQARLVDIIRRSGMLAIGPNTIGLVVPHRRLYGSFVPFPSWTPGPIAIFAQTGIFAGAVMLQEMSRPTQRPGVRMSVDAGNKIDVDEIDFLHAAAGDPEVGVVGFYLEEIRDVRAFLQTAGRVGETKPVVLLKPGRTVPGASASASHTGALAVDDRVLDGALRQHGVLRAEGVEDFLLTLRVLAWSSPPAGPRVAVVSYSGALGVMAVDEIVSAGLELAEFAPATRERLAALLPAWQVPANPADLWVALEVHGNRRGHEAALEAVLADPHTDMVLAILLAPPNADFPDVREVFAGLRERHPHKAFVLVIYGGEVRERWLHALEGLGVPVAPNPRVAVRSLAALARWAAVRRRTKADIPTPGRTAWEP